MQRRYLGTWNAAGTRSGPTESQEGQVTSAAIIFFLPPSVRRVSPLTSLRERGSKGPWSGCGKEITHEPKQLGEYLYRKNNSSVAGRGDQRDHWRQVP